MSDIKIFSCDDSACIFQVNDAVLDPRPFYVLSADYVALKENFDAALGREAAFREELNQYEPASPGTASKRARWLLNIQDACKYGLPKHLVNRLNNTAKEIQNSIKFGGTKRLRDENESLQQRLTVAEQALTERNEFIKELIDEAGYDWLSSGAVEKMKAFIVALKPAADAERCTYCNQPGGQCCWTGGA